MQQSVLHGHALPVPTVSRAGPKLHTSSLLLCSSTGPGPLGLHMSWCCRRESAESPEATYPPVLPISPATLLEKPPMPAKQRAASNQHAEELEQQLYNTLAHLLLGPCNAKKSFDLSVQDEEWDQ